MVCRYQHRPGLVGTVGPPPPPPDTSGYVRYPALTPPSIIEAIVTRLDGGAPTVAPTLSATITTDNTGVAHVAATGGNYESGLLPSTTYYYVWTSINANGVESLVSTERSIATGVGVTPAITTQLTGAVSGAVKYRIYRGTASGQQNQYYETTSTTYKDTGSLSLAFHACIAGYTPPTVTPAASVTTASGGIPLAKGALTTAMLVAKTIAVWVDDGGGLVEKPAYVRGIGRYSDGSYRSVYFKVNVGTALPAYLRAEYTGETGKEFGTLRSAPTYPTYGFRAQVRFGVARTTTDLTTPDWHATHGFTDPTSHLPPQLWLEDVRVRGFTPGVIAATDPNYLTKCGAFGYFATRAESENVSLVGSTFAAIQTQYRFNFDEIVRDSRYNGVNQLSVSPFSFSAAFNSCNRTVRCQHYDVGGNMVSEYFDGPSSWLPANPGGAFSPSNPNRDERGTTPEPTWSAETPPQYGMLRDLCGSMVQSGPYEQQNYDPSMYLYIPYLMTGDLAYYQRAANHAWEYAWWARWYASFGTNVVPWTSGPDYSHQPEGIHYHALLTAEPLSMQFSQAYAQTTASLSDFADTGSSTAEGRPMARRLQGLMWAQLVTRPTGDSGIASSVALNVEAIDYASQVVAKLTKAFDTGTSWLPCDITVSGIANAWCQIWGTGAKFVNTYMQTMVCDAGMKALERHDELSTDLQNKIRTRVKTNGDFLMGLMEFDVYDNPFIPWNGAPGFYRHGNWKNFFDSGDGPTNDFRAADWRRYATGGVELNQFYAPLYFWLDWQYADGSYTKFGEYVFELGTGNGELDAITGPYIAAQMSKSQGEEYTYGWRSALWRVAGPSASTLSNDTLSEIRAGCSASYTYPSTGTVASGNAITIVGKRRTARRRIIRGGSALTRAISAGGHATVGAATWNSTWGYLTFNVTGVSVGVETVTVTDPDSGMTGTCVITVT